MTGKRFNHELTKTRSAHLRSAMLRAFAGSWLICFVLVMLPGCKAMGLVANAVAGGNKTEAMYTLAPRPTVVIAEKFDNPAEAVFDAEPLSRYITESLQGKTTATLIDSSKIYSLQAADRAKWRGMTIAQLGRAVNAEQIIYISIVSTSIDNAPGSDMIRGEGAVRVRVVDAATGGTLWPADEAAGYTILAQTRIRRRGENAVDEASVRSDLLRDLSSRVAQMFYTVSEP